MYFQPPYFLELAAVSPSEQGIAVGRRCSAVWWGKAACLWAAAGTEGALQAATGKEQGV